MKLKNKFLIIFFIMSLLLCLTVVSAASEYDFVCSSDYSFISLQSDDTFPYSDYAYYQSPTYNDIYQIMYFVYVINDITCYSIQPYSFKKFVDDITNSCGDCTYELFLTQCEFYFQDDYFSCMFYYHWLHDDNDALNEEYFNKLYYYGSDKTYNEGVTDGIKQAHEFTSNWLSENEVLFQPSDNSGDLASFEKLLNDNIPAAIVYARKYGIDEAISNIEFWLSSNNILFEGYEKIGDASVVTQYLDGNVAPALNIRYLEGMTNGQNIGYKEGVNASLTRMESWLSGEKILTQSYDKNGDVATVDKYLDDNVIPALTSRYDNGYNSGYYTGIPEGETKMYNELMRHINTAFKTEYPTSDGFSYDFTVPSQAYTVAYEAGELYQLNKFTDDGGISDFLADISGTVLSTFFYLGTNISFMGTTALSLISLFVIAAIVIFILKFFNKG